MARQGERRLHRQNRIASPLRLRKSPKAPMKPAKATVTRNISSPAERSAAKVTHKLQTKQTISAAGIFKKQPKPDRHSKKRRKHREATPEPTLFESFQYGITEARAVIGDQAEVTFDHVHASFTERLAATRADDEAFFQRMDTAVKTFSSPLEDEKVQTGFTKGGKVIEEVFRVGDRVATFKKIVEQETLKLEDLWKQWDEVQNEYLELGVDVFGRDAFGIDTPGLDKGFEKEMTLLGLEHDARVSELGEEIDTMGTDIMKKMMASEKDSNAASKKDQARLLQTFL